MLGFIPGYLIYDSWNVDYFMPDGVTPARMTHNSYVGYFSLFDGDAVHYMTWNGSELIIVVIIAAVIPYAIQFLKKNKRNNIFLCVVIPLAEIALIIYNAIISFGSEITTSMYGDSMKRCYNPGAVFYIIVVLICLLFLISLIGYRKVKKGGIIETEKPAQSMKTETAYTSSADELIKYKKLLDDGAITQDEYDVKKKELLNL